MKEIEKTQINGKISHAHVLERITIVKISVLLKAIYRFSFSPYQNLNGIFQIEQKKNPKICMDTQDLNSQSNLQKEQSWLCQLIIKNKKMPCFIAITV